MNAGVLPLCAGALLCASCVVDTRWSGPQRHETRSIDRDAAERVRVSLRMGAGELRVAGGSAKLLQADFDYPESRRPNVRYHTTGAFADLSIEEPGHGGHLGGNQKYLWDLRFNDQTPMDFTIHLGAGQAILDLGSLYLRNVEVNMGAGEARLDLRGKPRHDYSVSIHGGVGEVTVRLPVDAGIYADASGGIGEIRVKGLNKEGDHWVNDAYRGPGPKVRVDVHGGIGAINLLAE